MQVLLQITSHSHTENMPLPTLGLLQSFCKQQITDLLPANVCRPRKGTAVSIEEADEGEQFSHVCTNL